MVRQITHSLLAGVMATAAHYALMTLLVLTGMAPVAATVAGAVAGAGVSYVLCREWVFRAGGRPHQEQIPKFLVATAMSALVNGLVLAALWPTLGVPLAQLLATLVAWACGYLLNRCRTFPAHMERTG